MWALAAEEVFGADVNIMVINARDEYLSKTPMWKLSDIERQVCNPYSVLIKLPHKTDLQNSQGLYRTV